MKRVRWLDLEMMRIEKDWLDEERACKCALVRLKGFPPAERTNEKFCHLFNLCLRIIKQKNSMLYSYNTIPLKYGTDH